jgi:succinyl-diaminopimelate desuccinylase
VGRDRGQWARCPRLAPGVDAIVKTGPILTALGQLDRDLGERTHPLVGRGSVHASVIEGGSELSSYPSRCRLGLERRTLPGETAAEIDAELASLLGRCRSADPELVASLRTLLVREPFEVAPDADVVDLVLEAAAEVLPARPMVGGASYWADAAFIAAAGIPTVMFGPGGAGAHAAEEWVSIDDLVAVTRALTAVASRLCA